ncbi:TMEM175 family protein [Deinococcus sonorensis]|uniref:TMEM175 family protein n=2 Tax=Deinococcus sonorensis TaxID=309891 RepID=A0AAU7UD91_9DEIO
MAHPEASEQAQDLKNVERLKFFTDAVVAIALTLLILPLLESVSEAARTQQSATDMLAEHSGQIMTFALSFVVVASFWIVHHRIFEHVSRYTPALMGLSFLWMFTIVLLQFPTAMVGALSPEPILLGLYIGLMALSSLILSAMTWLVSRDARIRSGRPTFEASSLAASFSSSLLFVLVLCLALLIPGLSYYALFLLFLNRPLQRLLQPYFARLQTRLT